MCFEIQKYFTWKKFLKFVATKISVTQFKSLKEDNGDHFAV